MAGGDDEPTALTMLSADLVKARPGVAVERNERLIEQPERALMQGQACQGDAATLAR